MRLDDAKNFIDIKRRPRRVTLEWNGNRYTLELGDTFELPPVQLEAAGRMITTYQAPPIKVVSID